MVQCYSCQSNLQGSWSLRNCQGYNNGIYTGVKAYFAYSGTDWIYCFCPTCYSNGKFAQIIKSWYAASINSTIQEEVKKQTANQQQILQNKQNQIRLRESNLKKRQNEFKQMESKLHIKQLQEKNKLIDLQIYDTLKRLIQEDSRNQVIKTQKYYKQIQSSLNINSKQFMKQLSGKLNSLIKTFTQDFFKSIKQELKQLKSQVQKDLQKLKVIQEQTLNSFNQTKSFQNSNSNLFSEEDIKNCQIIFVNKRKIKEERLQQILRIIEIQ